MGLLNVCRLAMPCLAAQASHQSCPLAGPSVLSSVLSPFPGFTSPASQHIQHSLGHPTSVLSTCPLLTFFGAAIPLHPQSSPSCAQVALLQFDKDPHPDNEFIMPRGVLVFHEEKLKLQLWHIPLSPGTSGVYFTASYVGLIKIKGTQGSEIFNWLRCDLVTVQ